MTAWNKAFESSPAQDRPAIVEALSAWHQDSELAGIRDAAALAKLPADEHKEWQSLWARVPEFRTVVPNSKEQGQKWRYTTDQPAEGWQKTDFDDKKWQEGVGAFGSAGYVFRTEWKTDDIWLRREFTLPSPLTPLPGGEGKGVREWDDLLLVLDHDDDAEVYVNGVLALNAPGYALAVRMPLSAEALRALRPGKNVFAVHCRNTIGPQCTLTSASWQQRATPDAWPWPRSSPAGSTPRHGRRRSSGLGSTRGSSKSSAAGIHR